MIDTLAYLFTTFIVIAIPACYIARISRKTRRAKTRRKEAIDKGQVEPVSLYPKIDPIRCIGTAACVPVCPEGEILGILDGRAELVSPTKCIGHGACEAACPVEAITLVFGTEHRGVEIPFVSETFETNVEGIYIAGELGGMGLIRNAMTQGKEAVDYIGQSLSKGYKTVHDIAIVGAGPAGIAATLQAQKNKLKYINLEQDDIGGTVLSYPRQKLVMTQPMEIPLYGKVKFREIIKEELMGLWGDVLQKTGVEIKTKEKVESVERQNGFFRIRTGKGEYLAQRVLLAIGRRGTPRKLGVVGEKSSKVAYRLLEPEQYRGRKVLVVGGGDSAIEAALSLSEQRGTQVTLSYRKNVFSRIKAMNENRLNSALAAGQITSILESNVVEIKREVVAIQQNGDVRSIPNDYVFIFAGGELPTEFLKKMGIRVEKKFGQR